MLDKNLIKTNLNYKTSEEVILALGKLLYNKGYVHKEFIKAVLDRELKYPTGIPTEPALALPHTSSEFVKKAGIAVALLKNPVEFYQMGGNNEKLDVKIVFMLAIDNPEKHLKLLQRIMDIFEDNETLKLLQDSNTIDDVYNILSYINS